MERICLTLELLLIGVPSPLRKTIFTRFQEGMILEFSSEPETGTPFKWLIPVTTFLSIPSRFAICSGEVRRRLYISLTHIESCSANTWYAFPAKLWETSSDNASWSK